MQISSDAKKYVESILANPFGTNFTYGLKNNFLEAHGRFQHHLVNGIYVDECRCIMEQMQVPRVRQEEPISLEWERLLRSIHSESTRKTYLFGINFFLKHHGINHLELLQMDVEMRQRILEKWVLQLNSMGYGKSSIKTMLAGLEKLMDMNRVVYYKKIIHAMIPNDLTEEVGGNSPYDNSLILQLLSSTTIPRTIALIHWLASSGGRVGSIADPALRMKHVFEIENCYAVRIYDKSESGFSESSRFGQWVFLSPEARKALDNYLEWRQSNGEVLNKESVLFASFSTHHNDLRVDEVHRIMKDLHKKSGINKTKIGKSRLGRYDVSENHSYRKRFESILVKKGLESRVVDKLVGRVGPVAQRYYRPTKEELFEEFKKVIPELTIEPANKLKIEMECKNKKLVQLEQVEEQNKELSSKVQKLERALVDTMLEQKIDS